MNLPLEYADRPEVMELIDCGGTAATVAEFTGGLLPMPVMFLRLPFPPTANSYYRRVGSRTLISAKGRAYRKAVAAVVAENGERMQAGRYAVVVSVFSADNRRRDLDNLFKSVGDSLTKAGVWADDSLVDDLRLIRCEPQPVGGIRVAIRLLQAEGM